MSYADSGDPTWQPYAGSDQGASEIVQRCGQLAMHAISLSAQSTASLSFHKIAQALPLRPHLRRWQHLAGMEGVIITLQVRAGAAEDRIRLLHAHDVAASGQLRLQLALRPPQHRVEHLRAPSSAYRRLRPDVTRPFNHRPGCRH